MTQAVSLIDAARLPEIPAIPNGVTVTTLENGLTIIVREDHSAPVVSAQAWCRTGSVHEGRWLGAGLSHVLEHMLFKGTTTRGAGRIDQEVQSAGGSMNAYTSFDRTVYYINVPNTGATVAIDILCDIMQHATLPADELVKELDVIRREMDMGEDDPNRKSGRRLFETAYTRSPYRMPIIGYLDIFNQLTAGDIRAYYEDRYTPNNVFYVVTGDVKTAEVVVQIRTAYAGSKARPLPSMVLPPEPRQSAPREVIEEAPDELGHLHYAWHIPDIRHPDVPALDVLSTLLGSGRSSRLYQELRERQGVVVHADAWTYNPGDAGLVGMSALVNADKFQPACAAMLAEVERMREQPVTPQELAKAVKQFTAATLGTRKTMQGQANDLGGNWIASGDLNFSERYLAAVKRLTPDDLLRVSRQYLTPENRTLYALLPTGTAPGQADGEAEVASQPIQKFELPNGLRLLVKEDHRLPFVEFRAVFQGGVLAESAANNGVTQIMARTLLKGTATRTAEQIATEIESLGGSIDSYGGNNSFGVNAEVMSEDLATGLALLTDVILNPVFADSAFEREREVQLAAIQAQRDHLLQSCSRLMRGKLFGETGYGLDASGTTESVSRLTAGDLKTIHQQLVVPNNCVLAVFGAMNTAAVRTAVEQALGQWSRGAVVPASLTKSQPFQGTAEVVDHRDKKQAVLVMGFQGTTVAAEDRPLLDLISEACSDLGSRLFMRIRDELGLAYYVGSQHAPGLVPGYFTFYCGTSPEQVGQVRAELLKEAALLRNEGLSTEELERAKAKLIGHRKIARQDLGGLAAQSALDELYGLGFDRADSEDGRYQAATEAQIRTAAQRYLREDALVVAVIQPKAA